MPSLVHPTSYQTSELDLSSWLRDGGIMVTNVQGKYVL
jgi:hypothetical protein